MKIDKRLNMVTPVECADGSTVYVHSAPVSKETFDKNFLVMSRALTMIYTGGLGEITGPRVAAKMLVEVGEQMGRRESADAVISEMRRLTNVLVFDAGRWLQMPFADAIARGTIDEIDADEVENANAFFILASAVHKQKDAAKILPGAAQLWSALLTPSNSTEYAASLPTSTQVVSTGATATPSSIPS